MRKGSFTLSADDDDFFISKGPPAIESRPQQESMVKEKERGKRKRETASN
jgi:hypothetical protein